MKRKLISLVLALTLCTTLCCPVFAQGFSGIPAGAAAGNDPALSQEASGASSQAPKYVNPYFYEYKQTSVREEWGDYKRVSDNITTGSGRGSITCTRLVLISGSITGNHQGLSFNIGKTYSSSLGYTLEAGPNQSVYMAYRVRFEVESGTRYVYDAETGKLVSSNPVTIHRTLYGEYKLLPG